MMQIKANNLPEKYEIDSTDYFYGFDGELTSYKFSGKTFKGVDFYNLNDVDYLFIKEDIYKQIRFITDTDSVLRVPDNDQIFIGEWVEIKQAGIGKIIFSTENNIVLNIPEFKKPNTRGKGSYVKLTKVGEKEWDIHGDLEDK